MTGRALIAAVGLTATIILGACEPYRIEHHHRPAYYEKAALGELPSQVVLDDGTMIVYEDRLRRRRDGEGADGEVEPVFLPRQDLEDGRVILRARKPEHVLANVFACLQNSEYELLWEQMISDRTKAEYEQQGQGYEEFAAYFKQNRKEIARTMKRMLLGLPREEVRVERYDREITTLTLRPQVAAPFKFTRVAVVREGPGLKLLVFR